MLSRSFFISFSKEICFLNSWFAFWRCTCDKALQLTSISLVFSKRWSLNRKRDSNVNISILQKLKNVHLFLSTNHRLNVMLIYETSNALCEYFGRRKILEAFKSQFTFMHRRIIFHDDLYFPYSNLYILIINGCALWTLNKGDLPPKHQVVASSLLLKMNVVKSTPLRYQGQRSC